MKKIIGRKRYDTEKATLVAAYDNGLSRRDFGHIQEGLYRTPGGRWFLAGDGGPTSKYAVTVGNMSAGGENIIPLTPDGVLDWLEAHDRPELIEQYFGDAVQDA